MKDFRNLQVWHKAHALTLVSYKVTDKFPKQEIYGLTSQVRRCAVSIAANIAEGWGKHGNAEFQRFLNIAISSASELEYHFLLVHDLKFISDIDYKSLHSKVVEIKRMLAALVSKIQTERLQAEC